MYGLSLHHIVDFSWSQKSKHIQLLNLDHLFQKESLNQAKSTIQFGHFKKASYPTTSKSINSIWQWFN